MIRVYSLPDGTFSSDEEEEDDDEDEEEEEEEGGSLFMWTVQQDSSLTELGNEVCCLIQSKTAVFLADEDN